MNLKDKFIGNLEFLTTTNGFDLYVHFHVQGERDANWSYISRGERVKWNQFLSSYLTTPP